MLPESYRDHLATKLNKTQYLMLSLIVGLLTLYRKVSVEELATKLPLPILMESRRKKLQRFLELPILTIEEIWLPIIKNYVEKKYNKEEKLYIAIDRTQWKRVNLMMVSLIKKGRGIPLYFELLPHKGSSNAETQKQILGRVLPLFNNYEKVVLGDREFCSVELALWLKSRAKTDFCLRLKKNEYIEKEPQIWQTLGGLGLKPGVSIYLKGVKVTKTKGFADGNIAAKWKKKYRGFTPEEGWFILTSLCTLESALSAYRKRFGIEEMFRDFKRGGYHIEDTQLNDKRLTSLLLLITLSYVAADLRGEIIRTKGLAKYVGRVREKNRTQRRHSDFYLGLHADAFIESFLIFAPEAKALMDLNPHKRLHHQKCLQALIHI